MTLFQVFDLKIRSLSRRGITAHRDVHRKKGGGEVWERYIITPLCHNINWAHA